jgi:hypothetical protein
MTNSSAGAAREAGRPHSRLEAKQRDAAMEVLDLLCPDSSRQAEQITRCALRPVFTGQLSAPEGKGVV